MKLKNKRIGLSKKTDYLELLIGKTRMLIKNAKSWKLRGKSDRNFYLNRRFALCIRVTFYEL